MRAIRFRRQQPIGPYIADFYCPSAKLVIELDGSQHGFAANTLRDEERTRFMVAQGLTVLRFGNRDVYENCEMVVDAIWRVVREQTPPRRVYDTSTLPRGEG
jgi:very-short-patch-repair endonuclease